MSDNENNTSIGKVVTLNKDNFQRWIIEIKDVLRAKGLWSIASGKVKVVKEPTAAEAAANSSLETKWEKYDKLDSKARAIIRRTLDATSFNHVADCQTSQQILERVTKLREPKSTDVIMTNLSHFFTTTWKSSDDVSSFICSLVILAAKVNAASDSGAIVTDTFIIAKTMTSLPPSFQNFKESWQLVGKKGASLDDFRESLLMAERNQGTESYSSSSGDALATTNGNSRPQGEHSAPSQSGRKEAGNRNVQRLCDFCHFNNHSWETCLIRLGIEDRKTNGPYSRTYSKFNDKPSIRGGSNSNNNNDSNSRSQRNDGIHPSPLGPTMVDDDGTGLESFRACSFYEGCENSIIVDSGASRHLTNKLDWFSTLNQLDHPLKFTTANNNIIEATHLGTINCDVSPDGKSWINTTWTDVFYCPQQTSTTLVSTGYLARKGFSFSHGRDFMQLSRDGRVFIGGKRVGSTFQPFIRINKPRMKSSQTSSQT